MYDCERNVCICSSKFVNAGIVNSLPRNGHEGAHVPVGEGMKNMKASLMRLGLSCRLGN